MGPYLGDFAEDATVHFIWDSNDSDGASITRATDGTISVYKDNGVAQSTAGVTDTEDFDSLTGIHACTIDLSADAFYATGSNYSVVLSAATIDGQTVNAVLAHFSIENRTAFPKADYPTNFASLGIEADGDLTKVNTLDGHTAQTGDSFARIGAAGAGLTDLATAAALTTVDTVVDAIKVVTDNLPNSGALDDLATLAARLTALRAGYLDELAAANIPADVDTLKSRLSATRAGYLDNLSGGAVALASALSTVDTVVDAIKAVTDNLPNSGSLTDLATAAKLLAYVQLILRSDAAIETDNATELTEINADGGSGAGNFSAQTDAVEALRDRGDAEWITATGFSTHDAAAVLAAMQAAGTHLTLIKAVTDLLPDAGALTTIGTDTARLTAARAAVLTDWIDGGRLDLLLDACSTLDAAAVNAEVVDALATDTHAEPGQGAPAATASLKDKIGYLYKFLRNKIEQNATTLKVYNDAGDTVDQQATVSDDGTDFTRGEIGSG